MSLSATPLSLPPSLEDVCRLTLTPLFGVQKADERARKRKKRNKMKTKNLSTDVWETVWLSQCVLIWKSEGRWAEISAAACSSCDFTGNVWDKEILWCGRSTDAAFASTRLKRKERLRLRLLTRRLLCPVDEGHLFKSVRLNASGWSFTLSLLQSACLGQASRDKSEDLKSVLVALCDEFWGHWEEFTLHYRAHDCNIIFY